MKPAPFEYHAPTTLEAALELKAEHGDDGKPLAGGQSLIPAMNFRVAQPSLLIDLNHVPELRHISKPNGAVHIGSMTLQSTAERDPLVAEHTPLLHEAIPNIAHPQIRNRGTIGGSLAHADPASELPVVALALGARFRAQSKSGERWIEAKDFFAGLFATTLQPDELLVEIAFPTKLARTGYCFTEVARRHGDYAMAGLAAMVTLGADDKVSEARLVYLNVGDGPLAAASAASSLAGQTPNAAAFKEAGRIASQEDMSPYGNIHATPEYQRHLSAVLTERALHTATERAKAAHA